MSRQITEKFLSGTEITALLKKTLGKHYETSGENLPTLKYLMEKIDTLDNTFSFMELIPIFDNILSLKIFSIAAESTSILSIFLMPISSIIDVINAYQAGRRMYSFRGVAYALTAWSFNDAPLSSSPRILANAKSGFPQITNQELVEYTHSWKKSAQDAATKIETVAIQQNIPKPVMKLFMRILGGNSRQQLCQALLRGFENRFNGPELVSWKYGYRINYPS